MATLDVRLKKINKIYKEGDVVAGVIVVTSNGDLQHQGITLTVDGAVTLQLSAKSVGLFEAFYNSLKPIHLINYVLEIAKPGKLPSGKTEIPFEVPLKPKGNKNLYETYHGVFINVQRGFSVPVKLQTDLIPLLDDLLQMLKIGSKLLLQTQNGCFNHKYSIKVDIKRSLLSKDLQKQTEFIVENKTTNKDEKNKAKAIPFSISPETLTNVKEKVNVPKFKIKGKLTSSVLNITEPLTGELMVESCDAQIKSIEIQLVRVETCGCAEGYAKDATEIQNIQIADGDICRGILIPIYMIFPRLFTCPTLSTNNFKIDFEINVVVVFRDDHLVTENFPIKLVRY